MKAISIALAACLTAACASTHPIAPATGTYKLACTHFGHAALGMTGKIVVH